jgi:hypothetical protein
VVWRVGSPLQTDWWSDTLEERIEFTFHDMSAIELAIRRHRDRIAQLLDDVDALSRSAAELRIGGPNGDAAHILDL